MVMRIFYTCEHCGKAVDMIEVDQIDEEKLGFDCLTPEERQDIIKIDPVSDTMHVHSLCDECIESLGVANEGKTEQKVSFLH